MLKGGKMKDILKKSSLIFVFYFVFVSLAMHPAFSRDDTRKNAEIDAMQKEFSWWPTDAKPAPVKDTEHGGYWWWPNGPGKVGPLWGNRGYCYVRKIIYDYKAEELPPPKPQEMRPSLLIKKIIKNVKIYFDYNKSAIRQDARPILDDAIKALAKDPQSSILITGNCDVRGSEAYNEKLGRKRGEAVKDFMLDKGIPESRIKIVSRGKLDAIAPITDLEGMQKDRNAQFMVADVEEVMIPYEGNPPVEAKPEGEGKFIEEKSEKVESPVKVSQKDYTIRKGDTLWKIAEREMGSGYRWKYLYELNKDKIKNPNKLKAGKKIIIPIE